MWLPDRQNTITRTVGATPIALLGSSPARRAFALSPIAPGSAAPIIVLAQQFLAGAGQTWHVPAGVTSIIDVLAWGSGGNPGASGAVLGGGGGGGGGFADSGPLPATPATVWTISVDAGGGGGQTLVQNPAAATVAQASSGQSGLLDAAGTPGAGVIGANQFSGGAGAAATALAGAGGGGGGAAGAYAVGSAGALQVGGAGGGAALLFQWGLGGAGSSGAASLVAGVNGFGPGGGGGGSGNTAATNPVGADGLAVIVYQLGGGTPNYVSVSHRSDVVPGLGIFNYLSGATYPTIVTARDVGRIIIDEWWFVASVPTQVQVTEYLCDEDDWEC